MPPPTTYLHLPFGDRTGWGIVGLQLARAMAALAPVRLLSEEIDPAEVGGEMVRHELTPLVVTPEQLGRFLGRDGVVRLDGPLLTAVPDAAFVPDQSRIFGMPRVGYSFFEDNLLSRKAIASARRYYDSVATGSTWCTGILRGHGVTAFTAVPGVDGRAFHPLLAAPARTFEPDRFVVYSGGKFEHRKGQDVVIRAFKVLQGRHRDVFLVNTWHNPWDFSFDTMARSKLIRFRRATVDRLLADNGIDRSRVLTLGPQPRASLARIYHDSDVGIFPSRAEGGPNLVLAEYMACGKPAIATATTGQADVVTARNALLIATGRAVRYKDEGGRAVAAWPEPSLESAVEQLEWAYRNRGKLAAIGARAARDMGKITWAKTARTILRAMRA